MKINQAALLTTLTLTVALCACDKGESKDGGDSGAAAPVVKSKKPKDDAAGGGGSSAQPPAAEDAGGKPMNTGAVPPPPAGDNAAVPDAAGLSGLEAINGAIKMYNQKKASELMTKMGPGSATGGDLNAQKAKYMASKTKGGAAGGASAGLTSLNDLVKAGVLKSIPEAPAGKKFVFDAKTQEVKLENK